MLSEVDVLNHLRSLGVPEKGQQYVIDSRNTAPTRQIGRGAEQSVTGHMYSHINQGTRCFESGEELAWIRRLEFQSKGVLEYHAQPAAIWISGHDKIGRSRSRSYTPDFLVLEQGSVKVVDVKTVGQARELTDSRPKDWVQRGGSYHFLPGEQAFDGIGLKFSVAIAEEISRLEARNYTLLHRVRCCIQHPDDKIISDVLARLSRVTYLTLGAIREQYGQLGLESALWLIDRQIIHADLARQSLVDDCAIVAASQELLHFALEKVLERDQLGFAAVDVALLGNRKAVEHYADHRGAENKNSRTGRRYRAKLRNVGPEKPRAAALMPQFHKRGNYSSKVAPDVKRYLAEFLTDIPNQEVMSKNKAFNSYKVNAKKIHPLHPPVSKKTFLRYYADLDPVKLARRSGGRRAANQVRPSTPAIKRHARAQRPLERVVMDHTKLDFFIRLLKSSLGVVIVRPWLTVVSDEATGFILFYLITLTQPSKRVFGVVIRHIARRYGRVFEALHSDGGKDMNSIFTRQLVAEIEFTYSVSPAANSRWNGLAEGAFATIQSTYVCDYPANCIEWPSRSTSRGYKPMDKVVDDLLSIHPKFDQAIAAINNKVVSGNLLSRELHFRQLLERFPMSGIPVQVDERFMIATAVECGDYTVSNRGTFQKLNRHYSPVSDNLITGPRTREIREDCENPYLIYYLSDGQWKWATAPGFDRFDGLSEHSRKLEAALKLEGAEARTKLNELADEHQYERLVELANEERELFEERKAAGSAGPIPKKAISPASSGVFNRSSRSVAAHDEQED